MQFYMLDRPPRTDDKVPLDATDGNLGCVILDCPVCGATGVLPKQLSPWVPIEIAVQSSGYLDDIEQAFTTLLVSQKFRDAVAAGGLTGIEFRPPVGFTVKSNKPSYQKVAQEARDGLGLEAIWVIGRGGSVAEASGVRLQKSCDVCGVRDWTLPDKGYHVDESQWDGSDFFYVEESGALFMTQRAVDVLEMAELSNFGASLAEDYRPLFPA